MTIDEQKTALAEVDSRIEELRASVELGEAIKRLHENEDFLKVIVEGYMDKEAERLFGIVTNPTHFKRDQLENTMDRLGSIRNIKEYFMVKLREADAAPEQITAEDEYRREITSTETVIDVELA